MTKVKGVKTYRKPAGGWGALRAVAGALSDQETVVEGGRSLLSANQPDGFDCPGCAWPDPKHTSSFEFCENGAKAVAWESTTKRATPEVVGAHTVAELLTWSDHALEDLGRLTEPMVYDRATDRYRRIDWAGAFDRIGEVMRGLSSPDQAEFYASGRASNEAAFLFQLMGRKFGTNNFPDCSNMCHEPTSVALPDAIGMGKGSVTLEDFDLCDAVFSFGHNPGTNHPRMMSTLRAAAKRGAAIVVFNPLRERALEKFASPQDPVEMATLTGTDIASRYFQVAVGGDAAAVTGMLKALLAADRAGGQVIDWPFVVEHTAGFEALAETVDAADWPTIEAQSGLTRADLEEAAAIYARSKAVILCYGMGITQHRSSSSAVHQLANLLLIRGNIGRPGAGICPLRGHSNVQGARSVGVAEKPTQALLDNIEKVFGFRPPQHHGHTVVEAIAAMRDGGSKALISLGGNFAVAAPDPAATFPALTGLDLTVTVATKLNRTQLLCGRESYILPCLGRTERDDQAGGRQAVTVEDSMSMVHASRGLNPPASEHLRSEPWIVAELALALLGPDTGVDWRGLVADYGKVRDLIEQVFPETFTGYNQRILTPGGFRLPVPPSERIWKTASGKANFIPYQADGDDPRRGDPDVLLLTTVRSHDQYNTTIYGLNDRYRGVSGRRDVIFASPADLKARGLADGDLVDVVAAFADTGPNGGHVRRLAGFTVVERVLPTGCLAAYYPEANPLLALADHDRRSGTPAYKSMPVRLMRAG
ncbi:molybdopterin-dependent oxidoreductase alpha subunit [Caulobacter ginsengisoli]|uniref:Molybdopterin-dependent oxidoreductase alpha subunit n=1 Tax=Caulobacter ginsengisoli TaxID=400775 RepID=A0ABU0ITT9_9CAUL|nr:FdhF/YdeP family oxidoreductase [Caulobacter ginsengisoli]MDQ0465409.1 molybdopterin-dependent oxidoreductase alpha subunit [Caulobacter ginsengisoli]